MSKLAAHVMVELIGMGAVIASAWCYDYRIGLLVLGVMCLYATTWGGLRLAAKKD